VIDAQRRLRDIRHRGVLCKLESFDVFQGLNEKDRRGDLPNGPFHLGMTRVSDQDQRATLSDIVPALIVDFRYQRASRVENIKLARDRVLLDFACHTMSAEDGNRVGWHLRKILDEPGTLRLQRLHNVLVVYDLVADIDRWAIFSERTFDDLDR